MPDEAGWNLMASRRRRGRAGLLGAPRPGADPVGYAPTAVTGFAIGYVIDKPDNTGEYTELRLNARLLAKLLTQSYVGSTFGAAAPGHGRQPAGRS